MILELLTVANLMSPGVSMGGIYCDEVIEELVSYQLETGAFTEEQLKGLIGRCEGWEEKYEEGVEAGEVEVINNKK